MWSRKPTPVLALDSPPSRSSESRICVSAVLRSLLAVRLISFSLSALIIADSPWTGKPSARAMRSTCGASFAAASAGISTVAILRRKVSGPSGPEKRPAPPGRKHVVGAGDIVAEGGGAVAAGEDAASGGHSAGERGRVLDEKLEVLRREGVGKLDGVAEGLGTWTSASGESPMSGRSAATRFGGRRQVFKHRLLDGDDDKRARLAVLGLGAEVERGPLGVGVVPRRPPSAPRALRSESMPDPAATPFASPPAPRRCPGPAITSTASIGLGAVSAGRRSPGRRPSRRSPRPRKSRRRQDQWVDVVHRGPAARQAQVAQPRQRGPGSRTSGRSTGRRRDPPGA